MTDIPAPGPPRRRLLQALAFAPLLAHLPATALEAPRTVIELRQYKIVPGRRDDFVALFERALVEPQEAEGMTLVGQFRDLDDPDRFTWIRSFPDMAARGRSLEAFYSGPVWQAHRGQANPLLVDNDNVLLLRPTSPGAGLPIGSRPAAGAPAPAGVVTATIHYLWKAPAEGFAAFFETELRPALEAAGLPVLASLVPEEAPNNFPRLPVRQGEKVLVWLTQNDSPDAHEAAMRRLRRAASWARLAPLLADHEERAAQRLRLAPTPRSRLR